MKIEYCRKLMSSYMIVEQGDELLDWEREMIRQAKPSNIIAGEAVMKDDALHMWYEITGKQSLDIVLQTKGMGYELFSRLMMGLYDTASSLEDRLLDTDGILLLPETIFFDGPHDKVFFCYYPKSDGVHSKEFEKLMESLLPYVDHNDEKCVACAYAVYEQACREGFGLSLLKDIIHLTYEKEYCTDYNVKPADVSVSENVEAEYTAADQCKQDNMKVHGIMSNRRKALGHKLAIPNSSTIIPKFSLPIKRQKPDEPFVFEPDAEPDEGRHPTVLLADIDRKPEGILLYEGNGAGQNIRIDEESLLIGNDERLPGFIPSATVSRNHARISKEGDTYWIEDLNSVNGTYIDGNILNYKERVKLAKNQMVRFADEKYRFI